MTELENGLKSYFGVIETDDMKVITSLFRPEIVPKGAYFLKTGAYCRKLSFVKTGYLRIFVETEKKEVTQWISTEGYFVTDLSGFIFDTPSRWNIQALTDTEIFSISKTDYLRLEKILPKWSFLEKLFIIKCATFMEDRIFSHLSMTAEERYDFFFEHNPELFNQVPLQYIASMLGMTPETFSRIRKKQIS